MTKASKNPVNTFGRKRWGGSLGRKTRYCRTGDIRAEKLWMGLYGGPCTSCHPDRYFAMRFHKLRIGECLPYLLTPKTICISLYNNDWKVSPLNQYSLCTKGERGRHMVNVRMLTGHPAYHFFKKAWGLGGNMLVLRKWGFVLDPKPAVRV